MIKSEIKKRISESTSCLKNIYSMLTKVGQEAFVEELTGVADRKNAIRKLHSLKDLKMAAIMDRFTLDSYRPECQLLEVTPNNWKVEMDEFQPHLLFVESAWEGKDKLWYKKVSTVSEEYCELVKYCRTKGIPVVFWNKEDPVWTDVFMEAAGWADYIFTTDVDCVKRYKTELGNDNVFLLHFAAQPEIHNPIEKYDRKDKFCFAGAYYHRYPERTKVFDEFSEVFRETKGFDIYDRNFGNSRPEHAFPEQYNDIILGKLDPSEIDIAYKGYNYGINMNSVNQSQTMFARRVFEMMASNTITVGNYAKGLRTLFGDLTICTNSAKTLSNYLEKYCADDVSYRKYRLLGLRMALSYHLYEDRLNYIIEKVCGVTLKRKLPLVKVYSIVENETEKTYVEKMFNKQSYNRKELIILDKADDNRVIEAQENAFITYFNPQDYYGENYLLDMILTLRYLESDVIGKKAFYEQKDSGLYLNDGNRYVKCENLSISRAICKESLLDKKNLLEILQNQVISDGVQFCIDEFNYCKNCNAEYLLDVDDLCVRDLGVKYSELERYAESIEKEKLDDKIVEIKAEQLTCGKSINPKSAVKVTAIRNTINITSEMEEEQHEYIYFPYIYEVPENYSAQTIGFKMQAEGGLNTIAVCIFLNENEEKISAVTGNCNKVLDIEIPQETKYLKFGVRPRGAGKISLKRVLIGDKDGFTVSKDIIVGSEMAVLTNHYPEDGNLYRNMFVHKRVMKYKEAGMDCEVLRINPYAKEQYREFSGVNVIDGTAETLRSVLEQGKLKVICVHFLGSDMWNVLKDYLKDIRLIVWLHGADIQPWWRRPFLYKTEEELEVAKVQSDARMNMWKDVFSHSEKYNIHFVFVSKWFADSTMEDYKYEIDSQRYSVIHNYIDEEMFQYDTKNEEQRKKIFSIRPYASSYYGNDLMAKAIVELSKRDCFNDLEFLLVGDGVLFEEITEPLRGYSNVTIKQMFLRQEEIAELYKEHGIVLIPGRGDTQGVSRDEAMIAGLVPMASNVMAVSEFVDEKCGYLAEEEEYIALADGIEELYHNPEKFKEMSVNAHNRVIKQCSFDETIGKEIKLILS